MTDDIHSCGPHCTRPGCKAEGGSLPVVAHLWPTGKVDLVIPCPLNWFSDRQNLVRLSDAQAIIDRLTRERDQALAEAKEIRARWNDAEDELKASRPDVDEVMALADTYANLVGWNSKAAADTARSALRANLEGRT